MSNNDEPFLITGDIFPEIVPVPFDDSHLTDYHINKAVFKYITDNYPNFNWAKYDERTNSPDFSYDNSESEPDGKVDYVVLIYRRGNGYRGASNLGSTYSVTTNYSGNPKIFTISDGFTARYWQNSPYLLRNFFYHEFAHNLYNAPHTYGANGVIGHHFYTSHGWGMMNSISQAMHSANAWERWFLGWIDLTTGSEQTNSDIKSTSDLAETNIFSLRDFVSTGDVMRIKIPHTENQYLWLENRTGATVFDDRDGWETDSQGNNLPTPQKGLVMFVEKIADNRSTTYIFTSGANGLRVIHSKGNWDFTRDHFPIETNVWHGHKVYDFNQFAPNPLSGFSTSALIKNDYYTLIGDTMDYSQPDNNIELDNHANSPEKYRREHHDAIMMNGELIYGQFSTDAAFDSNTRIGLGTNPTITAIQTYNNNTHETTPIILNGLSVEILNYESDGTVNVKVRFDDYNVANDVTWKGNIELREKLILTARHTIELDQSLTPSQVFRDPISGEFAKPTVFTCKDDSEFILEQDSELILKNLSTLVLESGSTFEIGDNAVLTVNQGDTLKIEPCARLIIKDKGLLRIKEGGVLCISEGAIVATDRGHLNLSIHNNAIIPTPFINPFDIVPYSTIISGNTNWVNKNYHANTITVSDGGHLTISNSEIFLADPNSKIIIKKGGKFEVTNNSKITSSCGDYWHGIYVEGNRTLPQTAANQGTLILKNGATIENARHAVNLRAADDSWWGNGGIIQASDSYFINNRRDVQFMSYQSNICNPPCDNISSFTNVQFITNDDTPHTGHIPHVTMWAVNGVKFNNCHFIDNRSSIIYMASESARDGIYSSSASFSVNNSSFTNTQYGIYAYSYNPELTFSVRNSIFNSYRGIFFKSVENVSLLDNTFTVDPGYSYRGFKCDDTYGVYIDHSSHFSIQNNIFISSSDGSTYCGSLGIIANNTGSHTNELYRNNFTGFTVGIETLRVNKGDNLNEGLLIKCNNFDQGAIDIFVSNHEFQQGLGIRHLQGSPTPSHSSDLAGNLFGNDSPILQLNYVNQGDPIAYFHHNPASESRVVPAGHSRGITLWPSSINYIASESCPNHIARTYELLASEKQDAQIHYEETSVLLQAHVDDGNTELMTQQVEMAGEGDAYNTYQYLMQTSPYLSEEVLTSLGAKEEGFNNAMIRDVMVENPQAAKSEEVTEVLDNRTDPLPAYMRWQINNGLYHFSEKEIMEQFIHLQKSRHDLALNEITRGIIHQSEGFELAPSLDELLAPVNDIRYQYLRAEFRFAQGDYVAGMQLLNTIAQQFPIDTDEALQAHQEKINFYTLLAQWDNDDYPGFTNLPEEVLTQLETYLEAHPHVAGKALSLLMLNQAIEYEELILYPQEDMLPKTDPVSGPDEFMVPDMDSELSFSLFPNPSRDYLTLDWCIESPRKAETGKIEIHNASGVLVHTLATLVPCNQQILPLNDWKSGTYTATIQLDGNMRKSITFLVAQ